jgi:ATP-dependent DNA ligase
LIEDVSRIIECNLIKKVMGLNKADLVSMWEDGSKYCKESFKKDILKSTGRGSVYKAADYITANAYLAACRKFNVDVATLTCKADLKGKLPSAYLFKLGSYSPMLAARYDELKEPAQKQLFEKQNYLFTEKQNGVRGWLIHSQGQWFLFSRNYSDKDCGVLDYWNNIYQHPSLDPKDVLAIDVEIKYEPDSGLANELREMGIETESILEAMSALLQTYPESAREIQRKYKERTGKDLIVFRLIYPLYFQGKNFLKRKLGEGHSAYNEVVKYCQSIGLNVMPIKRVKGNREEKENFLNTILESGGEGVVVHNLNAVYCVSENRDKDGFIKIKRQIGAKKDVIGDTIDAWVSGFKMSSEKAGNAGIIGALELSTYVLKDDGSTKEHVIAYCSNIPLEMRKEITKYDEEGRPYMAEEMYGLVFEATGQSISAVNMRLTHAKIVRQRFDKSKELCIITEAFLRANCDTNMYGN